MVYNVSDVILDISVTSALQHSLNWTELVSKTNIETELSSMFSKNKCGLQKYLGSYCFTYTIIGPPVSRTQLFVNGCLKEAKLNSKDYFNTDAR